MLHTSQQHGRADAFDIVAMKVCAALNTATCSLESGRLSLKQAADVVRATLATIRDVFEEWPRIGWAQTCQELVPWACTALPVPALPQELHACALLMQWRLLYGRPAVDAMFKTAVCAFQQFTYLYYNSEALPLGEQELTLALKAPVEELAATWAIVAAANVSPATSALLACRLCGGCHSRLSARDAALLYCFQQCATAIDVDRCAQLSMR
jgi:hypothetical protein